MRLIDADALMKALKDNGTYLLKSGAGESEYIYYSEAVDIINNAPTVEGEPVGWTNEMQLSFLNDGDACLVYPDTAECPIPLYTTPLQSQTVKEALEKAASICDAMREEAVIKYLKNNKAQYEGSIDALDIASARIYQLIEKEG